MTLHPFINDTNHTPFCGPTVIAVLTGIPVSQAERLIRRGRRGGYRDERGRKIPIRGVYTREVVRVLERLGCKVKKLKLKPCSFRAFADDTQHLGVPCLVNVTDHFTTSFKGMMREQGEAVPIADYHKNKRRALQAWTVEAPATPRYTAAAPAEPASEPAAPKPKVDIRVKRAQRVAALVAKWEATERRAKAHLKRLRPKLRRYQKLGVV